MQVKLLDCTLRDGGFLNDWNFGNNSILSIFRRLVKSNVDIIETGFIDDRRLFDLNRSINPDTKSFDAIFQNENKGKSTVVAMIDYGTCSIDNISNKSESFLDGIRVIFKKKDIECALKFCAKLKEKGYLVFVQPVSITTYTDKEMLDLIEMVNDIEPYVMSLVDTYGLLHKERLFKYFNLLDNNLKPQIGIGYHAHNNFQLAFSNAIELLQIRSQRTIAVDASLYGMGKSAGNCNTELIADYLNKFYDKNYDIYEIINAIELEILNLSCEYKWGYQLPFYLSAINECHPNYVKYLANKNTLPTKEINKILCLIEKEKRLTFNKEYIENLYLKYQSKNAGGSIDFNKLSAILEDKSILLIGPGGSIKKEEAKIRDYIKAHNVIKFSVNHINTLFAVDYLFISNKKRYDQFIDFYSKNLNGKMIITNNIDQDRENADYVLNYSRLINPDNIVGESSLYLLLKFFLLAKVKNVVLAGFDGFSKYTKNYYNNKFQFYNQDNDFDEITKAIIMQLAEFQKYFKIEFLTKTAYQEKESILV